MNDQRHQVSRSIIRTLLYYDIFNYPLTVQEVHRFLGTNSVTAEDVRVELHKLATEGKIFSYDNFFAVQNAKTNVLRRIKGNKFAERYKQFAQRRARMIGRFPFVRSVMGSGSFSKGYMDENSDLDFFIITAPGRLWIARMLIVVFKRLFFLNSHKYFCCNYFIDTDHLEIEEKNLFTATELATLLPLYGVAHYHKLMEANRWLTDYFPNYKINRAAMATEKETGIVKKVLEKLMNNRFGDRLNAWFMKLTLQRWKKLYAHNYSGSDFDNAFKTRAYVSKNHPRHFQRKVIERHEERIKWFDESLIR